MEESVLLTYQQEWIADESAVKIYAKSRRIGISWAEASDASLYSASAAGDDTWYVGYNKDMAQEFINDVGFWTKHFHGVAVEVGEEVIKDEDRDILTFVIKYKSGHRVTALSSRPSNLRGKQGRVIIDEAAFHDDLDGLIKAAIALLMWGGQVRIISTHDGEDNPFNLLIRECQAGKKPYSVHITDFRTAINQGLFKRICLAKGRDWSLDAEKQFVQDMYDFYGEHASEELDVIPSKGGGRYMSRVLVESCQEEGIPVLRFAKPAEWYLDDKRIIETEKWLTDNLKPILDNMPTDRKTVFGQDFGRSGDLSYILPLQQIHAGKWRTPFAMELRNIPFDCQELIVNYLFDHLPMFRHAKFDARGNGQSHAEKAVQNVGVDKVEAVMFTANWYAANFPNYKAAYEDKNIVVPVNEDFVIDHGRVVIVKGNPKIDDKRDKGSDGGWRHGDGAVAGVLAWAATREEGEPAAGVSVDVDAEKQQQQYEPESARGRRRLAMFGRGRRSA